jgi:DNA-binding NtrC family response regulator
MNLPRILIIDDLYGHNETLRRHFCEKLKLYDMGEGDGNALLSGDYIAQARFCSGQKVEPEGGDEYVSNDIEHVLETIRSGWPFKDGGRWSLLLIDYQFPTGLRRDGSLVSSPQRDDAEFGEEIVRRIAETWPFKPLFEGEPVTHRSALPFAMFSTCDPDHVEQRVDPLGSSAYIERPPSMRRPETMTEKEGVALRRQLAELFFDHGLVEDGALRGVKPSGEVYSFRSQKIIGKSMAVLRALRRCRVASRPRGLNLIFIYGEIGTGKELFAKYIHDHSRKGKMYRPETLSALPGELIGSLLFGYTKGAFTGAISEGKIGLLEAVGPGSLFLDEIGKCPPDKLELLLHPTGGGEFSRIGSTSSTGSTTNLRLVCQVICATNIDIATLISERAFPPDLLSRFNNDDGIILPPLGARNGDKKILFEYFLEDEVAKLDSELGRRHRRKKPHADVQKWVDEEYPWKFNVRELEKVARAVVRYRKHSGTIQLHDLEAIVGTVPQQKAVVNTVPRQSDELRPAVGFVSLMTALETFRFQPEEAPQVRGAMPRFSKAAGSLISRMLEAAATLPRNIHEDRTLNFTGCLKTIYGRPVSTTEAKNRFNTLQKFFALDSESEVVGQFIEQYPRSKGRRGGGE